MTASLITSQHYTANEYLALEVQSEIRNEYRAGEIVPMTGGTPAHNKLASALNALLWLSLRRKPYSVFVTDQRLWISVTHGYTYPDVMVVPEPVELQAGRRDTVTQPILIAEVLSKSTEAYDRGAKFAAYRTIPTLREYLLIDQYRLQVEQYVKQSDNQWLFAEFSDVEVSLTLPAVGVELAIADLYENVDFATESSEPVPDSPSAES